MIIDFTQVLLDLNGQPQTDENRNPFTLKKAAIVACTNTAPGDDTLGPTDKFNIGRLGYTISQGATDITPEDITLLKNRIGKVFVSPAFVYAAHMALDQKALDGTPLQPKGEA